MKTQDFCCKTCVRWKESKILVPAWNDVESGQCEIDRVATRAEYGCALWKEKAEREGERV